MKIKQNTTASDSEKYLGSCPMLYMQFVCMY